MLPIYGDHVIQQFAAAAAAPALGDTVLPRTSNCRSYSPNAHRANRGGNFATVLGIVIQDKKLDWRVGKGKACANAGRFRGWGGGGGSLGGERGAGQWPWWRRKNRKKNPRGRAGRGRKTRR